MLCAFPLIDMLQRKVEEVTQILEDRHCKEEECNVKMAFDQMTLFWACCFWIIPYLQILKVFIRIVFTATIPSLVTIKYACIFFPLKYCAVWKWFCSLAFSISRSELYQLFCLGSNLFDVDAVCIIHGLLSQIPYLTANMHCPFHSSQIIDKCLPKNRCQPVFTGCLLTFSI